jgi:hypothetical protein
MMELSPMSQPVLSQDELKTQVALAALHYVRPNEWVGVGTGSTVNKFIDALAAAQIPIKGAVSSSEASTQRMKNGGLPVVDLAQVARLAVYIDGADEIDGHGFKKLWRHKLINLCALQTHPNRSKCWAVSHFPSKSFLWLHLKSSVASSPWADMRMCA